MKRPLRPEEKKLWTAVARTVRPSAGKPALVGSEAPPEIEIAVAPAQEPVGL